MSIYLIIIFTSLFLALLSIIFLIKFIFTQEKGSEQMQNISNAIKEGAMAFMRRQYKTIFCLALVTVVLIVVANYFGNLSKGYDIAIRYASRIGIAFITGALCSGISGYIGMYMAVNSNIRAAAGAKKGLNSALTIALRGGAVTGLAVTSLSLLGVTILFLIFGGISGNDALIKEAPSLLVGFGFGASFVALFAQLGGGIYTKAADVGADLVGKVEAGIPEDDPRNPAVVADLVGDNVGDCAGRGADLFESTAAENIGAMILGVALYPVFGWKGILFPLVTGAVGIISSIAGLFFVKADKDTDNPMSALYKGYLVTTILNLVFLFLIVKSMFSGILPDGSSINYLYLYFCAFTGIVLSYMFVIITDYYTSYKYRPVKSIAESSKTGAATNIITGISVGMESTALPVLFVSIAIFTAYKLGEAALVGISNGGLYGIAIATIGMLSTCAYILAMDTFGPITDNAGGIVEMSGAPDEVRLITDKLDACGNTTKALTKGYAIGSAALATFLLFFAYLEQVKTILGKPLDSWFAVDIGKTEVFIGAFLGAMVVYLFASTAIRSVGKAAQYVILEVRRQLKEIPGILEGKSKPDYATCVDIVTKGALKEMILPGIIPIAAPIIVGLTLGKEAAAGFLMICTISGVVMALFLNNGGGAWDNAKKFIELGNLGGKKSETHKGAVVGDTVGDPFKDTAGPSLHVLIKLISTLTLVLVSLFR
ncbi:sodium-translocating pyrophosphatase [Clostridium sp. OS1-26]|uniref:sodium-translocating pyrophosphatase n=1 Tax=Clostridium sp. OS1-26 TaxID=3070681 RepID=UPI0027DFCA1A|nr:sodium-translocating pyrophosphatase [Clostridium sp. OS1-26]WML35284.1 sodium-translocating pyrophosphatase [Clostridium sp. OS1-26]